MIISEQWLRQFVNPNISTQALADKITTLGLEVDGIEPAAPEFSGVVVGEIVAIEQHPDADKLRVCQVAFSPSGEGNEESVQVVCGAHNARQGLKMPFATVGAVLPGNFKIKKAKLRGVESFGMLCASSELGLSESSDGLWEFASDAPVGTCVREYLALDDQLIDVDLTPNRGDCLSIVGVGREVATAMQVELKESACEPVPATIDDAVSATLSAPEYCSRYVSRVIKGVNNRASAPIWMSEALRRAGVRSLSPIVDITNYVMLELGQPMHAFDLSKLEGDINVRLSNKGEKVELLDGSTQELDGETLVISDAKQAHAMAGVMGGAFSAVQEDTQDVLLESAFFAPEKIIGKPRNYGMHTDSSHRFERGVDPQLQERAIERATQLALDILGGSAGPVSVTEAKEHIPTKQAISLRNSRITRILGLSFEADVVKDGLTRLGMTVSEPEAKGDDLVWQVTPPSFRFDINIEADLIEELVRLHGYENIDYTLNGAAFGIKNQDETTRGLDALKSSLVQRGYQEAVCYSFISQDLQSQFEPEQDAVALMNPISSDLGIMRTSLIPGLVSTLQYNLNRQQKRVRLFESGLRFIPNDNNGKDVPLDQNPMLAGIISGQASPEGWHSDAREVDFYDLKGDVEAILSRAGLSQFEFEPSKVPFLHPGQSADVFYVNEQGDRIYAGFLGALHPKQAKSLKLKQKAFVFELFLDVVNQSDLTHFEPLSEFPATKRDIALVADDSVSCQAMIQCIRATAPEFLQDIRVFDVYQGDNLTAGSKSVALSLILQAFSRTLDDSEIDLAVNQIVHELENSLRVTLRDT